MMPLPGHNNTPSKGVSLALGIMPKQAAEGNAELRRHGITSAEFDPKTGLAHWSDKRGRDALLRLHNAIDNDGAHRKD
jgi:hypothetical protein